MTRLTVLLTMLVTAFACDGLAGPAQSQQVCATVPELGSIVREIGGEQVTVTVFAKGTQDAHFVEAKPSFIKSLSQADMYVQVGMGLEGGWAPVLVKNARNTKVDVGGSGFVDASTVIQPLQLATGKVDRSQGDVHPFGNPHYLLDPLNGLKVASLVRDKLIELKPNQKAYFAERYDRFARKIAVGLVGESMAEKYSVDEVPKLCLLYERGALAKYLKDQGEETLLGGWLGAMLPHFGAKVVDDHNMWPYFARRFGLEVVTHLEPKPGVQPTTQHLGTVIELMRKEKIAVVLANAYYDPRHAQFVGAQTGAKVANMAHQAGARPGTDEYVAMVDYNVRQLAEALRAAK